MANIYTKSHDNSIKAIAQKIVDGAAVDHLIWEYLNVTNSQFTSQTKVIKKLGPFAIPPIVVRPDYNPEIKEKIKETFLNMHKDPSGKIILKKIFIDRFTVIDDNAYGSIREMEQWLERLETEVSQ